MDGLAWLVDARSRLRRRSCRTALAGNRACCGCVAAHKTECRCPLPGSRLLANDEREAGLCGFCEVWLRARPLETPGPSCGLIVYKLCHGKLAGSVNGYKEIELTFVCAQFGNVDMEISNRVALKLLPFGFVAFHIW
jgi:hypothetical protein